MSSLKEFDTDGKRITNIIERLRERMCHILRISVTVVIKSLLMLHHENITKRNS